MKLKHCLFVLVFLGLIIGANYIFAKDTVKTSPKVKQIISYSKKGENDKAVTEFKQLTPKELDELTNYIEANPGSLPPIYFVMLADNIYEKDKDKAVFFYSFGKVRATEDVRMCKDTSAREQLYIYSMIAPKTVTYMSGKNKDYDYIDNLYKKVIEWDNKYKDRVSPIWACYHGIQAFQKSPELLPDSEFINIQKEVQDNIKNVSQKLKEYHKTNKP